MKSIFYKFHCLGNSFIVVPYCDKLDYSNVARKLCDKSYGIGADGLIVAKVLPYELIYYNQDGSLASFCGNGIRAFLAYLYQEGYLQKRQTVPIIFSKKIYDCLVENINPFISKVEITGIDFLIPSLFNQYTNDFTLNEKFIFYQKKLFLNLVRVGVLHLVLINNTNFTNKEFLSSKELEELSALPIFTEVPNIDIVKIINDEEIEVLTFERGVGYTESCGSGAVASCAVLRLLGILGSETIIKYSVRFSTKENEMFVKIKDQTAELYGPTKLICKGECDV